MSIEKLKNYKTDLTIGIKFMTDNPSEYGVRHICKDQAVERIHEAELVFDLVTSSVDQLTRFNKIIYEGKFSEVFSVLEQSKVLAIAINTHLNIAIINNTGLKNASSTERYLKVLNRLMVIVDYLIELTENLSKLSAFGIRDE